MYDPSDHRLYYAQNSNTFCSLSGITNISVLSNISRNDGYYLGNVNSLFLVNAPPQVEVNLEFDLIQQNNFLQYSGINPICFRIYNGFNFLCIQNLYLDSYNAQFTVGSIPKINAKFTSYSGPLANSSVINTIENPTTIQIPNLNSICLSGFGLYRSCILDYQNIYSFNYSLNLKRCVFYDTNSTVPEVISVFPISTSATINSKFLETASVNESNTISLAPIRNLCFYILNSGSSYINIFPMENASIISSEVRYSDSNFLELKRDYLGFYGV